MLGSPVFIFEPDNIRFVKGAKSNFKKLYAVGAGFYTVFGAARHKKVIAWHALHARFANRNHARALQYPPKLVAMLVCLQAKRFSRLNGNYFYG